MRRLPTVTSLFVTVLLVAACGSGDKEGAAGTTTLPPESTTIVEETTTTLPAETTTLAPVTTATTKAPVAVAGPDMTAKATAAVFQQSDFPTGFEAVKPGDGGLEIERLWKELMACLGVATTSSGSATSPTFLRGLATQGRSTVEYMPEASSTAIANALAGPKFGTCFNTAFSADVKRSAPEGGVPGPVTVAPYAGGSKPAAPAKTSAYRVTVEISLGELKVPLFQDFFVIFTKGAVIRAFFLQPGAEFPQDLEKSVIEKVIARA